ncbi:MAG: cytochrome c biogenesis protein CcdA [Acidobacteriota bacterium]
MVEADGVHPGTTTRIAVRAVLPENLHVQSDQPRDPSLIPTVLTLDPPAGVSLRALAYPEPFDFNQEGLDQPLLVFGSTFVVGAELSVAASVPAGPLQIPGRLRYQACDDKVCFAPTTASVEWTLLVVPTATAIATPQADEFAGMVFEAVGAPVAERAPADAEDEGGSGLQRLDRFAVVATTGGYLPSGDFLQFVRDAESGVAQRGWFEGRAPLTIVLIVLLGGLALNLTPCVLPMIPINLAIIGAGAQAGSKRRGFLLGSAYGAAMALVYGVLGLVVVLTAGTFGTINASPWFNLTIAVLFVGLALAMFDVFEVDFSRFSSGFQGGGAQRGSFLLAFSMGAVAALLAGACVAPVVIQVVLFSSSMYAGGTVAALLLPFFLGVGMALPWPIAGAGLARLPKPGPWMVRVKQAFGVIILGTAVYYGYTSYTLFADRWVDAADVTSSVEEKLKEGWFASLEAGLAAAEREQKPVLIDMWATWCKNCLTMDKTTFKDPDVVAALSGYVKIKFQAEDPDAPVARELMTRFSAVGLPAYAILETSTPDRTTAEAAVSTTGGSR